MSIWNEFQKIYCINLPGDISRKNEMEDQFTKFNINDSISWMSATRPPKNYKASNYAYAGEFGVSLSHLKIIIDAIGSKKPVLIFEDDAVFADNTETILTESWNHLPDDWSIIYVGGKPLNKLIRYNNYLCKTEDFIQLVGYILNPLHIKNIAKYITDNLSNNHPLSCIDSIVNKYAIQDNSSYCYYPPIVHQRPGYSTLRQGHRDYVSHTQQHWNTYKP